MRSLRTIPDAQLNGTQGYFSDWMGSWWRSHYLTTCFANKNVCISFWLCFSSALLWVIAHCLLLCFQCRRKDRKSGDTAFCAFYCFLGNMSAALGAFLSHQLTLQIFMGVYMAVLDVFHFILVIFPVCPWSWQSKSSRKIRPMRRRRRQKFFAVSVPLAVGAGYVTWCSQHPQYTDEVHTGRHLLNTLLQDNTEILGYALGLMSFIICLSSKFPHISRAYRGKMTSTVLISTRGVCILASVSYALAIVFHDMQLKSALKALPWLLTSVGSAVFDSVIILISCLKKHKEAKLTLQPQHLDSPETETLLGYPASHLTYSTKERPRRNKTHSDWVPLKIRPTNRTHHKMAEIGRYMDVNIKPVQEVNFKGLPLSIENPTETLSAESSCDTNPPAPPPLKVICADVTCSSDSSTDTSMSSSLEWDFEDTKRQWSKADKQQKNTEAFPLQDWTALPISMPASQSESDCWFYDSDITMADEGAPTLLADYGKERQAMTN
ncbi:transmembrane protein 44 isoform X1 [Lepisosteus oculatus]|uniref:transmembrane protein 44 isoform X1 n=1 Tax=Lepisosteus oculatus TaxID=7918 RepID=UPI0035F527E1